MSYTDEDIAFLIRIGQIEAAPVKETKPKATDKVEE
jgi:hypothetical protein